MTQKKEKTELDYAIEAVVLGKATKKQAMMYARHFPEFQNCGRQIDVYIPQRGKTVPMIVLYDDGIDWYVAAVRTCGVIVAYNVAYNTETAQFVAFHRITKPY
ncbi:MAG: hypothetical protein II412_07210 [Clostridia bacterium]|nr:hypothetical protein [Clostridia bacterium]